MHLNRKKRLRSAKAPEGIAWKGIGRHGSSSHPCDRNGLDSRRMEHSALQHHIRTAFVGAGIVDHVDIHPENLAVLIKGDLELVRAGVSFHTEGTILMTVEHQLDRLADLVDSYKQRSCENIRKCSLPPKAPPVVVCRTMISSKGRFIRPATDLRT